MIQQHLARIKELSDAGQIVWATAQVPNEQAMRSFEGRADGYLILVCQANIVDVGVQHFGMATFTSMTAGVLVMPIQFPKELADELYHKAAAGKN